MKMVFYLSRKKYRIDMRSCWNWQTGMTKDHVSLRRVGSSPILRSVRCEAEPQWFRFRAVLRTIFIRNGEKTIVLGVWRNGLLFFIIYYLKGMVIFFLNQQFLNIFWIKKKILKKIIKNRYKNK